MQTLAIVICSVLAPVQSDSEPAAPDAELRRDQQQVQLITLEGEEKTGLLEGWTDSEITVAGESVGIREVHRVKFAPASPVAQAARVLALVDGSQIAVDQIDVQGKSVQAIRGDDQLSLPSSSVRSYRVSPLEDRFKATWNELAERESRDDAFVRVRGDSLDHISCVLGSVTADQISLRVGQRDIEVPIEKAFGVIYGRGETPGGSANVAVTLTDGSRLFAKRTAWRDGGLAIELGDKLSLEIAARDLAEVNLAATRIALLSQIEPRSVTYAPFGDNYDEYAWQMRVDRNALGSKLRLNGRNRSSGLWIHSGTTATFPMPRRVKRLQATAGIDELEAPGRPVLLELVADGRTLYSRRIEPGVPQELNLDLAGTRSLTIRAGTTEPDGHGIREHLVIVDARVILE